MHNQQKRIYPGRKPRIISYIFEPRYKNLYLGGMLSETIDCRKDE